ncbi:MAG: PilN domain-containing protein [Methylacidiphilales bacterium]|nr:PilN domain-containing protein [Candidatus Methylacidiphilales bacterium]
MKNRLVYRINLLPWRNQLIKEKNNIFFLLVAIVLCAVSISMYGVKLIFDARIEQHNQRVAYLDKEITYLNKELKSIEDLEKKKRNLQDRMSIIEQLQKDRPATVQFFQEIMNVLPENGIWLDNLSTNGLTVTLRGFADTAGRVSSYVNNINTSPVFTEPRLSEIKEVPEQKSVSFGLTFLIKKEETENNLKPTNAAIQNKK